jgi:hypothetical protein
MITAALLLLALLPALLNANPAPKPEPAPLFGFGIGRTQSAGAEGILLCEGKPAANVLVKLYDDDRGIDTDDLMVGVIGGIICWANPWIFRARAEQTRMGTSK